MPALAKLATATALALSLAGGATAIAQTTAVEDHATFVEMIIHVPSEDGARDRPVIQGAVPCDAPIHERLIRSYLGRPDCDFDGYAYAVPQGQPAPWEGEVTSIDDQRYVDDDGEVWHVTEIAYRTVSQAPEGGSELVHALAAQLHPTDRSDEDAGARYKLPVDEDLVGQRASQLDIQIGPAPQPTSGVSA